MKKLLHLLYIITTIILFLLTFYLKFIPYFEYLPLILAFIPILTTAIIKIKEKELGTQFFLVIATIIALIGNQITAMTVILLIMLLAEYLEELIEEKTEKTLKSLIKLIPKKAILYTKDKETIVNIEQIKPNDKIIVKTGSRIPVDGIIIEGEASVNESSLTGESNPIEKNINDSVYAGTFVESGSIIVKVDKIGQDTFFGKIMRLIKTSESRKAKVATLADKIAKWLVPIMLTFIITVWIITGNITLTMTLLVFGSPLELTLVTPLSVLSGIIAAFRNGILIKGGISLENLNKSKVLIFDKTGTLTLGRPEISNIIVINPEITEKELILLTAIAEKNSGHTLAKAILNKAKEENISVPNPQQYKSITGQGVSIVYKQQKCFIGNKKLLENPKYGNTKIPYNLTIPSKPNVTRFYIGCNNKLYGIIEVIDKIRPNAKETIKNLKALGVKQIILASGDNKEITNFIAQKLDINQHYGNLLPDQKLELVESLQKKNLIVSMIGDGINDAPALKQANVGIALGAMGMEPAIEASDIVLMTNDITKILYTYRLSQKVFKIIKQNIIIGFILIHGIGIILAFLNLITPIQAALFHAVPDILMLVNSARIINFK